MNGKMSRKLYLLAMAELTDRGYAAFLAPAEYWPALRRRHRQWKKAYVRGVKPRPLGSVNRGE
tara:strand:+ start:2781 stop:2969 length:189 start_codon:yes stop_codon:yes gene_type:complete